MSCRQPVLHTIRPGDTLYRLAIYYDSSVPRIMADNPGIHPHRLPIGEQIRICPGPDFMPMPQPVPVPIPQPQPMPRPMPQPTVPPGMQQPMPIPRPMPQPTMPPGTPQPMPIPRSMPQSMMPLGMPPGMPQPVPIPRPMPQPTVPQRMPQPRPIPQAQPMPMPPPITQPIQDQNQMAASVAAMDSMSSDMKLREIMRRLWSEHAIWTRQLIISIADNLADEQVVTDRLLRNPKDFGKLYGKYFGYLIGEEITKLITDHLVIGKQLIEALKRGDQEAASQLEDQWYKNADMWASFLAQIDPYTNRQAMTRMLHDHLAMVTQQVSARLAGNYHGDVDAFDRGYSQVMEMANTMAADISDMHLSMTGA